VGQPLPAGGAAVTRRALTVALVRATAVLGLAWTLKAALPGGVLRAAADARFPDPIGGGWSAFLAGYGALAVAAVLGYALAGRIATAHGDGDGRAGAAHAARAVRLCAGLVAAALALHGGVRLLVSSGAWAELAGPARAARAALYAVLALTLVGAWSPVGRGLAAVARRVVYLPSGRDGPAPRG
jgi:hypothetical protein